MLYISVGCKVMLYRKLATDKGLVNRSGGFVNEIVYDIVEFESYTRPPFFQVGEKEKWIPLKPHKQFIDRTKKIFRGQFPICMAYAITGHKSQVSASKGKVMVEIGDKEATSGYLYVVCSRTTIIENLCQIKENRNHSIDGALS
jgi:hypothetical protein